SPACPACPPLVLPDLPRVLPAMRGGFFMPSLDGGLLLLELFLSSCRRRSATSWRKAAFSIRKTSISRCSAEIRSRISGRRIIHTLTHTSPSRVPKNRGPSRSFTKTVANQTHPSLRVTIASRFSLRLAPRRRRAWTCEDAPPRRLATRMEPSPASQEPSRNPCPPRFRPRSRLFWGTKSNYSIDHENRKQKSHGTVRLSAITPG